MLEDFEDLEELEDSLIQLQEILLKENLEKQKKEEYDKLIPHIKINTDILIYIEEKRNQSIENIKDFTNKRQDILEIIDTQKIGKSILANSKILNQNLDDFLKAGNYKNTDLINFFQNIKKLQNHISKFNHYRNILFDNNDKEFTLTNLEQQLKNIDTSENTKEKVIPNFF